MPEPIDIAFALRLPPEKAVEYFTAKGYKLTFRWSDMLAQAHAKAFTVAKVARMDVLQDIRGAVQKSLAEGQSLGQFRDNLEPTLKAKGWWGVQKMQDPLTGEEKNVQLGSPRRLRTIYRENLADAYVTGDFRAAQENSADRPYGQWHAVHDKSTRPSHMALDGKIFPLSDPFWKTHVPGKLDWGCRCYMTTLSEQELKDEGLKPSSSAGHMSEREVLVSRATGELRKVPVYKDPLTGTEIPAAVGRGYNPAEAAYQPDLDSYDYDIARDYVQGTVTGPGFGLFLAGKLGGQFPVAVLAEDFKNLIGAKSQTVLLNDAALLKNKAANPGLQAADYEYLPRLLSGRVAGSLVLQVGGVTRAFIKRGNSIYEATLQLLESGRSINLSALRRATLQEVELARSQGNILQDLWEARS
jgi:SPP1 gp7 family putative phage head morphogenesis protein